MPKGWWAEEVMSEASWQVARGEKESAENLWLKEDETKIYMYDSLSCLFIVEQ